MQISRYKTLISIIETIMSDNIPFDIQVEIIRSLPVKSLIRFRLVSKQWKSLICSSKFIAEHNTQQKHKHHLLLNYGQGSDNYVDVKYVSIVDDDTFPQHKFSLTVPTSLNFINTRDKIVSSQGLLFMHGSDGAGTRKVHIWNPTIRKSVDIDVCDAKTYSDYIIRPNLIVSFDMKSEEFTEIYLPDHSAVSQERIVGISSVRESLVMVLIKEEAGREVCSVWKMMEDGESKSFTKLYTINTTHVIKHIHGFRKSGEAIVETENNPQRDLFAYEPDQSKHINYIGISGMEYVFSVSSYFETLLLLDQ
jgi:hypothetical protein